MSTVWVPIRISFGTVSLMPIFGGWALCQAFMVMACLLGIAGANRVATTAISSSAQFQTLVNPMGGIKQAAQIRNVELYMVKAVACQRASRDMAAAMQDAGIATPTDFPITLNANAEGNTAIQMKFGGRRTSGDFGDSACGEIKMKFSPRSENGVRAAFGFRIAGINYSGIRTKVMQAHADTMNQVYQEAQKIVAGISPTSTDQQMKDSVAAINAGYFGLYTNTFQGKLQQLAQDMKANDNSGAITDQLLAKMQEGGWATLGAWYAVFAETNETMNEMLDGVVTLAPMADQYSEDLSSTTYDVMTGFEAAIGAASANRQDTSSPGSSSGGLTSATGNTSLGQWILGGLINYTAGASSTGYSNTINPIIAFKNLGDNGLAAAQSLYFAYKLSQTKIGKAVTSAASSGALSMIPGVGGIASTLASIAEDAAEMLLPVVFLLFVTAAMMAFYIPMVPFIQWFAAMIQWFASVLESLLGASLWAMAHFDTDGEGMGQRTSYGYTYALNNFARPIIMTFAFFIASATVTVMGTFLFRYFGTAVASAQGNSLTGLMSIVAYLVLFCVMGLTLINTSFASMLSLGDRLIGWIGSNGHQSALGHDVEQRVSGVFINAARGGTGAMQGMMGKAPKAAAGGLSAQVASKTSKTVEDF
jgi:conjugal transfer/type IV secretion protein DotA/TraY